jgi:heat shock protein HtpX
MEMCLDNPREGFSDIFATHPSVDRRVAALVQFAGGHDPGPLALPEPSDVNDDSEGGGKPFLPDRPPAGNAPGPWGSAEQPTEPPGPWGPHQGRQ